jgi:hypothetical protein
VLYASLLPLWEGFDEPFHYAYVESLAREHALPLLGKAQLPPDVWASVHAAPASQVVQHNLPWVVTFGDYFRMSRGERARIRTLLENPPLRGYGPGGLNYEAQQAPLAYVVLALVEYPWRFAGLMMRVWLLRLFCGVFAVVTTAVFLLLLARRLRIPQVYEDPLVFVVLSLQMFYATTAHIANDWLAVPLMIVLFERLVALRESPTLRNVILLASAAGAGLLTKAYFLALLPVLMGVLAELTVRRRLHWRGIVFFGLIILLGCGPWYLRNLRLYKSLSGMQQTVGGNDWIGLAGALRRVPWWHSLKDLSSASIWTGNNSGGTFSSVTIAMLTGGFALAAVLYAAGLIKRRGLPVSEAVVACGCAAYGAALVYSTAVGFWATRGVAVSPCPWYTQPIIPIALLLLFCGLARIGRAGAVTAVWLVWWSAYVISATYWAKLIPLYAGYPHPGKTVLPQLLRWYRGLPAIADTLSIAAMTDSRFILGSAAVVAVGALTLATGFSLVLLRTAASTPPARSDGKPAPDLKALAGEVPARAPLNG